MVLVNGTDGIGTGWSSYIPNFNPSDIVANLRRKLAGEEMEPMHPWYRGFRVRRPFFLCFSAASRADT
jgi:DNA topoisomerase-2